MAIPSPLSYTVVYAMLPLSALVPLVLFGSSTGTNNWLVPPDRAKFEPIQNITGIPVSIYVPSNGRLGMQYFCPNTAPASIYLHYMETGEILDDKDIPPSSCYWMEPTCDITYCVYNGTSDGALGLCTKFDIFNPKLPDDHGTDVIDGGLMAMYNIIKGFPGGGSCAAYRSAKWFHYFSFTCAVLALGFTLGVMALFPVAKLMSRLQEVMGLCAAGAGAMHLISFLCCVITLSVWGGSVTRPALDGSLYGSGFWVEVSACIALLFCAPVPFLATACELPEPDRDNLEDRYVEEMVQAKTVTVPAASGDAARLEKELRQVVMDRDSKAAELGMLQQQMGAKDAELESLRDAVAAKDKQIASLSEELAAARKGNIV